MKKLFFLLSILNFSFLVTNAMIPEKKSISCSSSCIFGSCSISGCEQPGGAYCGCIYGFAQCACGGAIPTRPNTPANLSSLFANFESQVLSQLTSEASVNVVNYYNQLKSNLLARNFNVTEYQNKLDAYKNAVLALPQSERTLIENFVRN